MFDQIYFYLNSNNNNNIISSSSSVITLTCSPGGWIGEGAAQTGLAECIWKAPQATAEWSCMIPKHSTQTKCFWLGINGRKTGIPGKYSQVRLRSTKTRPTYERRSGRRKETWLPQEYSTETPEWLPMRILTLTNTTKPRWSYWKKCVSLDNPYNTFF